ncbi:MAG: helix-turn-helix transcriptional regulator [Deltaproteobacteria bacterium]|nr:helix-turn-helix transcriptional regulator [Deltaproteobacteria bacterium]
MAREGARTEAWIAAMTRVLAHLGRPAALLGQDSRPLAVNVHAGGAPERLSCELRRRFSESAQPGALDPRFDVIRFPDSPLRVVIQLDGEPDRDGPARLLAKVKGLTATETEVFVLWVRGMSAKEIAEERGCSPHTVKVHVKRIGSKLGVTKRVEMMMLVARLGAE